MNYTNICIYKRNKFITGTKSENLNHAPSRKEQTQIIQICVLSEVLRKIFNKKFRSKRAEGVNVTKLVCLANALHAPKLFMIFHTCSFIATLATNFSLATRKIADLNERVP